MSIQKVCEKQWKAIYLTQKSSRISFWFRLGVTSESLERIHKLQFDKNKKIPATETANRAETEQRQDETKKIIRPILFLYI